MATVRGRDANEKEFLKLYDSLCYRHSRWEVWQDFVTLIACAISNSVDQRFYDEREKDYMERIAHYTKDEQEIFPKLFGLIVETMEGGMRDFLGELFMLLNLGNDAGGQFFTPYHLCEAMARVAMDEAEIRRSIDTVGYITINDCACGAGATLIAAADELRGMGINYQRAALFVAQDIDYVTALMCYIQLSMLGCAGFVRIGDSLCDPMTGSALHGGSNDRNTWYTPMFFSDRWQTLRALDRMKRAISAVARQHPQAETDEPCGNMAAEETPIQAAEKPEQKEPEPQEPVFEVNPKRRRGQAEGQLMFDLGGE